ncbi:MAG TPA: DUF4058 family protein [Isosphaeraceae bacterium]|nr:DUF4058 family protein [Isosphaeraceae bacterium]
MPLRDHFHSPLDDRFSWDSLHGQWPAMIVQALARRLPRRFLAAPHVHLAGSSVEIDVAALERIDSDFLVRGDEGDRTDEANTAVWAPPRPTLTVATALPDQDEYEIRVYDTRRGRRLVAAVEIVSPSNKDRPEHRRAFTAKCAALLQDHVCVAMVDLVTSRDFNLYGDLMDLLGQTDPSLAEGAPPLYAASCRWTRREDAPLLETWAYPLEVGLPLPTLPLWLAENFAVPLELESTYEETCRILRISEE